MSCLPFLIFIVQSALEELLAGQSNSESAILNSIAGGNQKAFTQLVDLYWNKVYSHALVYSKSSQRAQEITQDVFMQVWNKRHALTEVQDFKKFLFILGKNQIISSMRKKLEKFSGQDPVEMPELTLVPDQQLEYKQAFNRIMEAVEKLPPTRQKVFKLSRFEGMTYDEIAQRLTISRNTVKEHIVMALSFIRTYIHKGGNLVVIVFLLLFYY